MAWNNDDYVQVNERIEAFYAKYPEGSLRSEIVEFTEFRVVVKAWAYRTPDDKRPATGHSYLTIPGSTNFTKGSELENAETSAWGRALAALGFEVKRSVASKDEIESKRKPADKPLGKCEEHNEPWIRGKAGIGHVLADGAVHMKEEAA